ncbi:MAG TPA: M14 family zinc carboxypeptidase [Acidimicrobiales bacterium]|nr:M14 family zinc carboxypeptidase [Acidimicrobiales bacterium]
MHVTPKRRRLALALGLSAGLALAGLPAAQAGLLDTATDAVEQAFAPQLVTVTADLAQRNLLASSGLDVTEHAGHDYVEVLLHTPADRSLLESLGLPFEVRIPDLVRREAEIQATNRAYATANAESPLPSGRTEYRTLEQYNAEMKALADEHDFVELLELPHESIEGKTVYGIEIATGIDSVDGATDERPTFVLMGLHHAREWPSGEHTMELGHDLVKGYLEGDARISRLVEQARTVLIPVVNVDGFEKSITDGMLVDLNVINEYDPLGGQTSILATPGNAYKRKNCRPFDGADGVPVLCDLAKSPGGFGVGVDLNRNYGAFHGGPGAAAEPIDPTYHGPSGFSEPETQNVRELISSRHVTMLISNHTFSNLVLRPNGVNPQTIGPDGLPVGDAPDEDAMKELGARFTAQNGYANIQGWELYDTTGTTEDWSYNATGGYGYTFEIGPDEFHPPFPKVVDEYLGAGEYAGRGNREAYLIALEAALDPSTHSLVAGDATPGATLRLSRTGSMPTWEGSFTDVIETELTVPASGRFEWHTNPSTRPIVMGKRYAALADAPTHTWSTGGAVPAVGEHVDVDWSPSQDASIVEVALDWQLPDDLDLEVYERQGDELTQVTTSGNLPTQKEAVTLTDVTAGTSYVFRVVNYASVPEQPFTLSFEYYDAETVETVGLIEAWTLTCEVGGVVVEQVPVIVDRGQRTLVDLDVCGPKGPPKRTKPAGRR